MNEQTKKTIFAICVTAAAFFLALLTTCIAQLQITAKLAVPIGAAVGTLVLLLVIYKKAPKEMWEKITVAAMVAAMAFPVLCAPVLSQRPFVNIENRTMNTEFPAFTAQGYAEYPGKVEAFVVDTIPFRGEIIQGHSVILYGAFHTSPADDVLLGRDGWLFYNTAPLIDNYSGTNLPPQEELDRMYTNFTGLQNYLEGKGIRLYVAVAPEKQTVYPEYMPDGIPRADVSVAQYIGDFITRNMDIDYVHLKDVLLDAKTDDAYLYYTADTHWCGLGAYVAFDEMMKHMDAGYTPVGFAPGDVEMFENREGDLNRQAFLSGVLSQRASVLNEQKLGEIGESLEGGGAKDESLMVLHDSFVDAQREYFSMAFGDVGYVADYSVFSVEMMETQQPDAVLILVAERNMRDVFGDGLAPWAAYA